MPEPMTRRIHSSKFLGFDCASALAMVASTTPVRQATWSAGSNALRLFWKGYATHRSFSHTYDTLQRRAHGRTHEWGHLRGWAQRGAATGGGRGERRRPSQTHELGA